jgi:hypothetical protein
LNNLAAYAYVSVDANLDAVLRLHREALDEARRYGQGGYVRWQEAQLSDRTYEFGLWDDALTRADSFLAEVEAGSPHYLAAECYSVRASIRLGRNEHDASRQDIEQALAHAERGKDPQLLYPVLARAAHIFHELGDTGRAASLTATLLQAIEHRNWTGFTLIASHIAAWTISPLGRADRFATALEAQPPSPWVRAGIAYARGEPLKAAEICAGIGAATQEAYARLTAAKNLLYHGQRAEADEELNRAHSFYSSVGATHYLRHGEALLAESASRA